MKLEKKEEEDFSMRRKNSKILGISRGLYDKNYRPEVAVVEQIK